LLKTMENAGKMSASTAETAPILDAHGAGQEITAVFGKYRWFVGPDDEKAQRHRV